MEKPLIQLMATDWPNRARHLISDCPPRNLIGMRLGFARNSTGFVRNSIVCDWNPWEREAMKQRGEGMLESEVWDWDHLLMTLQSYCNAIKSNQIQFWCHVKKMIFCVLNFLWTQDPIRYNAVDIRQYIYNDSQHPCALYYLKWGCSNFMSQTMVRWAVDEFRQSRHC